MLTQRLILVALFLLALLGFNSLWVMAGGQYHVDLIFWPWKLGLSLTGAAAITMLATGSGKRLWLATALLLAAMVAAGLVSYQAHLNEPTDQGDETTDQLTRGERPEQGTALPETPTSTRRFSSRFHPARHPLRRS